MRLLLTLLAPSLLVTGCATQRPPPQPSPSACGNHADSDIQILSKALVPLSRRSTETDLSFDTGSATVLFRLADVLSVLKTRVDEVGYSGPEQKLRNRLTSYPPRPGFSDLAQYVDIDDWRLPRLITTQLLESGLAVVVDPEVPDGTLPEIVVYNLTNSTQEGSAKWREDCSSDGDTIFVDLDDLDLKILR